MSQIESLLQVRAKPRSTKKWFQPDFNSRELQGEAPRKQLRSRSAEQSLQEVTVIVMKPLVAFGAVYCPPIHTVQDLKCGCFYLGMPGVEAIHLQD